MQKKSEQLKKIEGDFCQYKDVKSPLINFIHKNIKGIVVFGASKTLKSLPENEVKDSIEKLDSEELKRQWISLERTIEHFKKQPKGFNLGKDTIDKRFKIMTHAYFTVMTHDANYQKFTSRFFYEYAKERGWK